MQVSDLTPDEVEVIRQRRAKRQAQSDARDFQLLVIATAHRFAEWSARSGYGLTFSTFANQFEYQDTDAKEVYAAVERIMNAAAPQ